MAEAEAPEVEEAQAPEAEKEKPKAKSKKAKSVHDLIREVDPNHSDEDPVWGYDIVTGKDGTPKQVRSA